MNWAILSKKIFTLQNVNFFLHFTTTDPKYLLWNREIFNKPTFLPGSPVINVNIKEDSYFLTGYGLKTGGKRAVK